MALVRVLLLKNSQLLSWIGGGGDVIDGVLSFIPRSWCRFLDAEGTQRRAGGLWGHVIK